MPVSKIKNLILLILALSVVCLLFLAVPMRTAQIQAEDALHAQLEELFASYDIQLDRGILPRSVDLYTVELPASRLTMRQLPRRCSARTPRSSRIPRTMPRPIFLRPEAAPSAQAAAFPPRSPAVRARPTWRARRQGC